MNIDWLLIDRSLLFTIIWWYKLYDTTVVGGSTFRHGIHGKIVLDTRL